MRTLRVVESRICNAGGGFKGAGERFLALSFGSGLGLEEQITEAFLSRQSRRLLQPRL